MKFGTPACSGPSMNTVENGADRISFSTTFHGIHYFEMVLYARMWGEVVLDI